MSLSSITSNGIQTRVLATAPDSSRETFGRRQQPTIKHPECTPSNTRTVWTRARDVLRESIPFSQSLDLRCTSSLQYLQVNMCIVQTFIEHIVH